MESTEEVLNEIREDADTDAEFVQDKEVDARSETTEIKYKRKWNSDAWKYFTVVDPDERLAKCKACSGILRFTSTVSNLTKHTKRIHPELITGEADLPQGKVELEVLVRKKPYSRERARNRSALLTTMRGQVDNIWKYFDITDSQSKMATCKLCDAVLSFLHTHNLASHVRRMHPEAMLSSDEEGEADVAEEQTSPIWAYFKCLSQALKIASCLICKERLDYETYQDLKEHLSRKHPQIKLKKPRKLMITREGDIYEVDVDAAKEEPNEKDADDTHRNTSPYHNDEIDALEETTVEYLEENMFNNHSPEPAKRRRTKSYQNRKNSQIIKKHITPTKFKHEEEEESCSDIFGKYVASLLKKLPKHKSDRLQVEILSKIMEAQTNDDSNSSINNS